MGWPMAAGVKVTAITERQPAGAAGLMPGDVIILIDKHPVQNQRTFLASIASRQPGTAVKLSVFRGGRMTDVTATLLGQGNPDSAAAEKRPEPDERALAQKAQPSNPPAQAPGKQPGAAPQGRNDPAGEGPDLKKAMEQAKQFLGEGGTSKLGAMMEQMQEGLGDSMGKDSPMALQMNLARAGMHLIEGREGEGEALLKRGIEAAERHGKDAPILMEHLSMLANFYMMQKRLKEAEPILLRVLQTRERLTGKDSRETHLPMHSLATIRVEQKRYAEAEQFFLRIAAARERQLGADAQMTLEALLDLVFIYGVQSRFQEAGQILMRVEAASPALGKESGWQAVINGKKGELYFMQGRYAEAEPLMASTVELVTLFASGHSFHGTTLAWVAAAQMGQGNWSKATATLRESTGMLSRHALRGARTSSKTQAGGTEQTGPLFGPGHGLPVSTPFIAQVKSLHRLVPAGQRPADALTHESFEMAQWASSSGAAQSVAQMAARGSAGNPALAALVRERQDLVIEWQKLDDARTEALGKQQDKGNAGRENAARLAAIDTRLAAMGKRLEAEFPDYAALTSPAPSTIADVQAQLSDGEALVLFLDTPDSKLMPEETFVWTVTKTDVRWVRTGLGTAALGREVQALRCGLDADAWTGAHCAELTDRAYTEADRRNGKPLPFDHQRAHSLYKALFGEVEDLIKGKHLLLVAPGPLAQLPFHVLVTAPPASGDHRAAAWLARTNALTTLPAVTSLKALRRAARPGTATKPLIAFGNPLLDGNQADPNTGAYYQELAAAARARQSCAAAPQQVAALAGRGSAVPAMAVRGGLAQVSLIRQQTPLPETADEICAVARSLKADAADIHLGAGATETQVKRLSASGQLAKYSVVHFATHGALAGEVNGASEPGLLLTPPASATPDDDGYLSASEIAALKLDANWVILSACNTAGGEAQNSQALSGLTRAFIYAQARALLVSHWAVDSGATVKLVTTAIAEMTGDRTAGRAEALRRAMLAVIDKGAPHEAHPAYWAPFIVVGEGAR